MIYYPYSIAVLTLLGPGLEGSAEKAINDELKKLQGTWGLIQLKREKNLYGERQSQLIIERNMFTMRVRDTDVKGTLSVNPFSKPKGIDLVDGHENRKRVTLCIYEFRGRELWIAMGRSGETKRPIGFDGRFMVFLPQEVITKLRIDEQKSLQGTWRLAHWKIDGEVMEVNEKLPTELIVERNMFRIVNQGKVTDEGTFSVYPLAQPKGIDISHVGEEFDGKVSLGVYELKEHELSIASSKAGESERPVDFSCKKESEQVLMIFKRQASKKKS